jgi:plasmid stabilization system protein ParE
VRFHLSAEAEADFERIYIFNIQRSLDWAERVERRLLARIQALGQAPLIGRPHREAGTRRLSIADIQYVIDYRVMPGAIEILRIQSSREIR